MRPVAVCAVICVSLSAAQIWTYPVWGQPSEQEIVPVKDVAGDLPPALKPNLPVKKFIFTVAMQYTGTQFLAYLLRTAEGGQCFHERKPSMVNFKEVLNEGRNETYNLRRRQKVGALLGDLNHLPGDTYCDVNHMFIKSHADVVLDYLLRDPSREFNAEVHIIVHRRYMPSFLRSAMGIGTKEWPHDMEVYFGAWTAFHRKYALIPPPNHLVCASTAGLIVSNAIDFEAQVQRLKDRYGTEVTFHESRLEMLKHEPYTRALFEGLGLKPSNQTFVQKKALNHHGFTSARLQNDAFHAAIGKVVRYYYRNNIHIPDLPSLTQVKPCSNSSAAACRAGFVDLSTPAVREEDMKYLPFYHSPPGQCDEDGVHQPVEPEVLRVMRIHPDENI